MADFPLLTAPYHQGYIINTNNNNNNITLLILLFIRMRFSFYRRDSRRPIKIFSIIWNTSKDYKRPRQSDLQLILWRQNLRSVPCLRRLLERDTITIGDWQFRGYSGLVNKPSSCSGRWPAYQRHPIVPFGWISVGKLQVLAASKILTKW